MKTNSQEKQSDKRIQEIFKFLKIIEETTIQKNIFKIIFENYTKNTKSCVQLKYSFEPIPIDGTPHRHQN